jgi:hypothetical protein
MSLRRVPKWLEELELRFGAMLALPLDRTSGELRATPSDFDPMLERDARRGRSSPGAQLAIYQRQYWARLFTLLHAAFPLTTRLLGHWHFNEVAVRFLTAHPPAHGDIEAVAEGFDDFVAQTSEGPLIVRTRPDVTLEAQALVEAARLDAAYHRVARSPRVAPFRPDSSDRQRLLTGRLVLSPCVALVTDSFGLCELRAELVHAPGETPVAAPERLRAPRHWALVRSGLVLRLLPLEPREHELLQLLAERPVSEALATLEASCSEAECANLPGRVERWLGRGVEYGFWCAQGNFSIG